MTDALATPETAVAKRPVWFWIRIAVSLFFALLTVALCVLWVRSYSQLDYAHWAGDPDYKRFSRVNWEFRSIYGSIDFQSFEYGASSNMPRFWASSHLTSEYDPEELEYTNFTLRWWDKIFAVTFPHWLAIAVAASMVAVPWLSIRRFSLRALLVATTLVAVVLAFAVRAGR